MTVVDYFLNSIVKYLQKKQKARKKRKRAPVKSKTSKGRALKRPVIKSRRRHPKPTNKKSSGQIKNAVKTKKGSTSRKASGQLKRTPKIKKGILKTVKKGLAEKAVPDGVNIGVITHYFSRIQVVVIKMTKEKLIIGDKIHIKGRTTDFVQSVNSLQIESVDVKAAHKGQLVGLKVDKAVKVGDKIYRLTS